ncbi:MAG TPA: hydantoinase B/oxoprolinase family protein [Ktedonobacteraceae bacterium]|nr:hydantoinase B/oxoprolinase family protein [Ktedonobacteraceae bacterium]
MQQRESAISVVGVDIGGTFTDLVYYLPPGPDSQGHFQIQKVPSTPGNPAQGLLNGLEALQAVDNSVVVHGSTVATNALLERKGARTLLITTKGFADVLEIGRQDRPALYDLKQQRPAPLIPRERRLELAERLDYRGEVLQSPTPADFEMLCEQIAEHAPESIAISLLYSYRNPVHEQALVAILRDRFPDLYLSLSSEILPQFREFERTSTVAVNAYVQPVMGRYLQALEHRLHGPLRIMQSSGGSISAATAAQEAVRTVLSGPAGGVIGAYHVARQAGQTRLLTLDMGGTSTDVALCADEIPLTTEAVIAGSPISVPTVGIHTVGAGGGSLVRLDEGNALTVGPESAGAVPGPACYGSGEELTVTDANLVLGRIEPDYFLGGNFTLYPERARERMETLGQQLGVSAEEAALGIIRVVNASMERALRGVSLEQGHDPRRFTLLPFGGAGPLHACELARELHISQVFVPRYPGVLSALGMVLAPIVKDYVQTVLLETSALDTEALEAIFSPLRERGEREVQAELQQLGDPNVEVSWQRSYDLRYRGQAYELTTPETGSLRETLRRFHTLHQQRFGHSHPDEAVQLVAARLKAIIQPEQPELPALPVGNSDADHARVGSRQMIFTSGSYQAGIYDRERLLQGNRIVGPALMVQTDSTFLLPPGWVASVDAQGNLLAEWQPDATEKPETNPDAVEIDPVTLEIFKHLFASAAEEMGVTLGRTAYSPNIKERKDYSCACFDAQGRLIAQAAHIPVHLGAMPASVQAAIARFKEFEPGDCVILNDPYLGGTHLPDITLVAPVFIQEDPDGHAGELFGFVACRAHHADIGGMAPGSMPMSRELYQEGVIIPPLRLARKGVLNQELLELFYRNVRTPWEREGDMNAQFATTGIGERRLQEIIARYGSRQVQAAADELLAYTARLTHAALAALPDSDVEFVDYLDDDGWGNENLPVKVRVKVQQGSMNVDFSGSAAQSPGCVNAVEAVTRSAVLYVVRCLIGDRVPANDGCLEAVEILVPAGSLLNPHAPAAVAAGNVETSQRVVDTLFGALAQIVPDRIPAASQGGMNNLTLGGFRSDGSMFAYYETMGGGMGARPDSDGLSGVHVHMSNTRNTPIEVLEMELPLRVRCYTLRYGSGGAGRYRGGDGLVRELQFLAPATVTLLTERRLNAPYGLCGGGPGRTGINTLERAQTSSPLPGKVTFEAQINDVLTIATPGGGGFLPEISED